MTRREARGVRIALRSLPARLMIVAAPLWFTLAVLVFEIPWRVKWAVALVGGLTLISPAHGFLVMAALAPLGQLLTILLGGQQFRMSEALVLAFLTPWWIRGQIYPSDDRTGPRLPQFMSATGWLFVLAILASIGIGLWRLARYPGELRQIFDVLYQAYYITQDKAGIVDGARLLEGLALVSATIGLFRRHPRIAVTLPAAMLIPASVAGFLSVLVWQGIGPTTVLAWLSRTGYRVSAHVADVNAAGSYFAMILCLALGMTARESSRRRGIWLAAAALAWVGLWYSESRTAFAAAVAVVVFAAAWAISARWQPRARVSAIATLVVVSVAALTIRARLLDLDPMSHGAGFRQQFNATSLRMLVARPILGVGVGQYYRTSALFMPPRLAWTYGFENAHNYFLQIGAELGLLGLILFTVWTGIGIARAGRALVGTPRDFRLLGVTAGVVALLATCLTGHPLLIDEVAYPFWIQFGLMTALAGSTLWNRDLVDDIDTPLERSVVGGIAAAIVLGAVSGAVVGPVDPPSSRAVDGFYAWEAADDGTRFRWTELYASVFVPADVTRVRIPVRIPTNKAVMTPMGIEVIASGQGRGRSLVGTSWTTLDIELPDADPPIRFKRIDLKMDRTWQPALYFPGNADLRSVGVQVAECQLFRER